MNLIELNNTKELLKEISRKFDSFNVRWAIGGSLLLYFYNIVEEFHDIDIVVDIEDAIKAKEILSELGVFQEQKCKLNYLTTHFYEFNINGIDIDLIGGFAIKKEDKIYDCSFNSEIVDSYVKIDDKFIPLDSLKKWAKYYALMDRETKVNLIETYLSEGHREITNILKVKRYKKVNSSDVVSLIKKSIRESCYKDYNDIELNAWIDAVEESKIDKSFSNSFSCLLYYQRQLVACGNVDFNGYIDYFYVDQIFQGYGFGKFLLKQLEHIKVKEFTSYVSLTALPFFESMGYEVLKKNKVVRNGITLKNFLVGKSKSLQN